MSAMKGIKEVYFGGNMNAAPALAGQSVGLINGVKPAKQIIDKTIAEFNSVCEPMAHQ
jgi:enoyl-[acyl-carrier protein] reductase II